MRPSAKLWTTPAAVLREEEEGGKEVVVGVFCHQRPDTRQTREELFARPACKRKFCLPQLLGALSTACEERVVRVLVVLILFLFFFFSFFLFFLRAEISVQVVFLGLLKPEENYR